MNATKTLKRHWTASYGKPVGERMAERLARRARIIRRRATKVTR